jgi:pSer/pThr/pTyr-binding forkhead associated (FHA) protein
MTVQAADYYVLRWTGPDGSPVEKSVPEGDLAIGRGEECDIVLTDEAVSRRHALIRTSGRVVTVEDAGSRNGIFVNGSRVETSRLEAGAELRIGGTVFELVALETDTSRSWLDETVAIGDAHTQELGRTAGLQGMPVAPRYTLVWTSPDGSPGKRELNDGALTIGRFADADIALPDVQVSRKHARFTAKGEGLAIEDLGSLNGTYLNGDRIQSADVGAGDTIGIGRTTLHVMLLGAQTGVVAPLQPGTVEPATEPVLADEGVPAEAGLVPAQLLDRPIISEAELAAAGVEVKLADYAALGAGLGSFMWVDLLRNSGVPAADLSVVGPEDRPYSRYARLCRNSQIPLYERLRSHSESCPDNLWGFPGYAVREMWRELTGLRLGHFASLAWSIFGEPTIAQTFTPRSGDVFHGLDREAQRIGYPQMWRRGRIRAIRKSDRGRLVAIISESDERRRRHFAVSARFMHLATGYPAIQLLPDLAAYRETYHDERSVVNAYEFHDHVYEHLRQNGGTVLLRGRGIVASRILQRLSEERRHNTNITVVHLHRAHTAVGHRYGASRRVVDREWEFQPFNWPKGCWGGDQLERLLHASNDERKQLLDAWGGTTTAARRDWRDIVRNGVRDGWYRPEYGRVDEVTPSPDGGTITRISSILAGGGTLQLHADYVIDCTGAVHDPMRSPLFADLIKTYALPLNKLDHLQVNDHFEVEAMRHGEAHMYAAGVLTLGGPHAAVDSFLGLQYAALRAADSMVRFRAPGLRHLNGLYSFAQWSKWARGVEP